jgi:two-component system chemotaxis response regulator CheB
MASTDDEGDLAAGDAAEERAGSRSRDRIIAIGASAGGVEALLRIVRILPSSLPAPIVVVIHTPPTGRSRLPAVLERAGALPARHAADGDPLIPGTILVAPPDRHIVSIDHRLSVVDGPRENGVRPAIDPLFRSVARTHGEGAIGVILSGTLDDGTAGIAAIRAAGGTAIAQEPADAICPGMPRSAIDNAGVDHVAAADDIGPLLVQLVRFAPGPSDPGTGRTRSNASRSRPRTSSRGQ